MLIDEDDSRPRIITASASGNAPAIYKFVTAGDDPNTRDQQGRTGLHLAAARGCAMTVKALLDCGVDPRIKDSRGRTALDTALDTADGQCIQLLEGTTEHHTNSLGQRPRADPPCR